MTEQLTDKKIPVLASLNVVLFPGRAVPMRIGRKQSVAAVEHASQSSDRYVLVVAQREQLKSENVTADSLYQVGTVAKLDKLLGSHSDGYQVIVRGIERVKITGTDVDGDLIMAEVSPVEDEVSITEAMREAYLANIKSVAVDILNLIPADTRQLLQLVDAISDLDVLINLCAEHLDVEVALKQNILASNSIEERALQVLEALEIQKERLNVQAGIRDRVSQKIGQSQREGILREQMRIIQEELGDTTKDDSLRQRVEAATLPDEVNKHALKEVERLEGMGGQSPESHVIRNYVETLLQLPWSASEKPEVDVRQAQKDLDEDHFGLEKVKQRIIQHLAVMKLKKNQKHGSILLLVGPPGVGKTSLGSSIAKTLSRNFVRVSLGGVRDEADIRGHRRTYIGAMPGRIIQGMKKQTSNDPVFLLDEIDKLGHGAHGDPASALLEVLDPEQNKDFTDHYLEVPYDLSHAMFIATANTLDTIPLPLLDRMEVIKLSGYTTPEKLSIAKKHLVPKQLSEHGIAREMFAISDDALIAIISHYTREAGVRELSRQLAAVMRFAAEKIVTATVAGEKFEVGAEDVEEILGPHRYEYELAERLAPPGVATGLAWTPMGGEILFIEATKMQGNGKVTITGQLGDVMKESAQIALSLVRTRLAHAVPDLSKIDLHIHVPQGAIPKDGPSAGVTMLTAMASLFTGLRVDSKLAMTGEVSLRGAILPVGGIKEKVIAAHRAGIRKVILAERNRKDLADVPAEIKEQLQFVFVKEVEELLAEIFGDDTVQVKGHEVESKIQYSPVDDCSHWHAQDVNP